MGTFVTPGVAWRYVLIAVGLLLMLIGAVVWWADRRKRRSRADGAPSAGG